VSFDVAKMAVEAAVKAGADYADARTGTDETESLTVRNQEMGRAARRRYEQGFSPAVGLERLVEGYRTAIAGRTESMGGSR